MRGTRSVHAHRGDKPIRLSEMGPFSNQTLQLSQGGCLANRLRRSFVHRKFIKDVLRIKICRGGRAAELREVGLGYR